MISSRKEYTKVYKIDNRTICDVLDQICKDNGLYPCVKQYKSEQDGRGAFFAILARWLGPNRVNSTALEAESDLQTLTYDDEKKA